MEGHECPGVEGYGPVGTEGQFGGVPLFVDALVPAGVPDVEVGEEAVVVFVFVAEGVSLVFGERVGEGAEVGCAG